MRTDSVTLSATAVTAARTQAAELFGREYLPDSPRTYASKVKNAQEAHEAIRPAGDSFRTPAQTGLSGDEFRLYELIWMRTVASQMKDAEGRSVAVRIAATTSSGEVCEFAASGRVIVFHGFLKAYVEGADDPDAERDDRETRLPPLEVDDTVTVEALQAAAHETRPPARYTEATLIRELEEREIGRPSTYAAIIGTILARGYVYKKGTALVPAWLAFAVVRLLEQHFSRLVDYNFTAAMEDVLDEVAAGRRDSTTELAAFYFGTGDQEGLKAMVTDLVDIDAREMSTFELGEQIAVRVGRYGPYVEDAAANRASVPEDLPPDELTLDKAKELLANPSGAERVLGNDPGSGRVIVAKNGRYGPYVTEMLDEDAPKATKPRTSSLFKTMSVDTVTLEDALRLLTLPRVVGVDPDSGDEISALNGRYGPYLKKGTDSRSLESEEQLLSITLDQALAIYAQPKTRGVRAATGPLRELGTDPVSDRPVVVKDGRFGAYVTDGEYNATLRKGDTVEDITLERASELLADKRANGPAPKRVSKAAGTKKATAKTGAKKSKAKPRTKKPAAASVPVVAGDSAS
jgi:DNA topoisomerase-1